MSALRPAYKTQFTQRGAALIGQGIAFRMFGLHLVRLSNIAPADQDIGFSQAPHDAAFQETETDNERDSTLRTRHAVATTQAATPPIARALYRLRRHRDRLFPAGLFSEPAWDLLLDLFVAQASGKDISITSACIAASAPTTTALRCIKNLESAGIVYREPDATDHRRAYIRLSPQAIDVMQELFEDLFVDCCCNQAER